MQVVADNIIEYLYSFTTKEANLLPIGYVTNQEKNVERSRSIVEINKLVRNLSISQDIELGIFEFSLFYCYQKCEKFFHCVYKDKVIDIIYNLNTKNNTDLIKRIESGETNPKLVGFLDPISLCPSKWTKYEERVNRAKNDSGRYTDLYKCYKCGESKCKITQMQTRSADEAMTTFIVCISCGNTWKG